MEKFHFDDIFISLGPNMDEELQEELAKEYEMYLAFMVMVLNSNNFFNQTNLREGGSPSVDPTITVKDFYSSMQATPLFFKTNNYFSFEEFDEFFIFIFISLIPMIVANARSTGVPRMKYGCSMKLSLEQHLLSFILYMEHNNTNAYNAMHWYWSRNVLCDVALFIT